tara:strand:- start:582 stop:1037 length:456 start_codon:yes stop_codon:yes gene_type:complete
MRDVWSLPASFMLPRDYWLNCTRDAATTEYNKGYETEADAIKAKGILIRILNENVCRQPMPRIEIVLGWQILFNGYAVGPKLDHSNGGKKGVNFPTVFYNLENVILSQQDTLDALKKLIAYIVDQLLKKKEWSGLKDNNGKILETTRKILS